MSEKVKKIYVERYKGFENFEMELNEKLTVIVGTNGTGKTTILEIIYNVLAGNIEFFYDDDKFKSVAIEMESGNTIKIETNWKIYINDKQVDANNEFFRKQKILYFPAEVTFKNYEVTGPNKLELDERDTVLSADKMSKELKQFLINQKYLDLNDIANGNIQNANRIENYKKIYNEFFSDKKFIGIDNDSFEPIFELNDTKEKITIDKLSSGEKQIFFKGGSLMQYGKNKELIVLIDEPETSMHPEWQQKILDFYTNIQPNAQFVFATHSPHIVSCCTANEIKVIEKKNNKIFVNEDIKNTYGATNEEILLNIFNLSSIRNVDVQNDLNEYKELFCRKNFLNDEEKNKMEKLKEKIKMTEGLSKSDIAMLEFKANTSMFEEKLKKLGE